MLQGEPEQCVPWEPWPRKAPALSHAQTQVHTLPGCRVPAPGGESPFSPRYGLGFILPTVAVNFKMVYKAVSHGRVLLNPLKSSPCLSVPTFLQTEGGQPPCAPSRLPPSAAAAPGPGPSTRGRGLGPRDGRCQPAAPLPGSGFTARRVFNCPGRRVPNLYRRNANSHTI